MQGEANKTIRGIDAAPLLVDRRAAGLVEARRLLESLAKEEADALQEPTAANARLFVAALRHRLQQAVQRCETRPVRPLDSGERLEQETELAWALNQCRHWMGDEATAASRLFHTGEPVATGPRMTFAEFVAIRALWRSVAWLGILRRPKARVHPGMIGAGAWLLESIRAMARRGGRAFVAAPRRWAKRAAGMAKGSRTEERRTP